ncbi:MAG: hypothetical protein CVU69_09420 [Deltaproteobacteria bacterium HGW-Deltaproteobacteria-4]|nr:MAG: hypothetical protein CVU69_09420 [Deltaproteobacteria bacterium HGW-Deltaproteobacteria-4]
MRSIVTAVTIVLCLSCLACKSEEKAVELSPAAVKVPEAARAEAEPTPPAIPVTETFEREPQFSLFARVGAYRPTDDDSESLGVWTTDIDHIQRTSGMRPESGRDNSHGWVIHGIKEMSSISFFAPLAVKPATRYHVSFDFKGELPKGGGAGISVLEYTEFLWIGEQFTEVLSKKYQSGSFPGKGVKSRLDWQNYSFSFTTSPQAGMIHLILYRDGNMDGEKQVFFDNIAITEVQ